MLWCPGMVINSNEQYDAGFFSAIFMLTQAPIVAWLDGIINNILYYYCLFNYMLL